MSLKPARGRLRSSVALAFALTLTSTREAAASQPSSAPSPAERSTAPLSTPAEPSPPSNELAPSSEPTPSSEATPSSELAPSDELDPSDEPASPPIDGDDLEVQDDPESDTDGEFAEVEYEEADPLGADFRAIPTLRVGAGPLFSLSPKRPAAVAFEASLGAQLAVAPYQRDAVFYIHPTLGYAHDGPGPHVRNAFSAGLGLGLGGEALIAYYRARYLVGSSAGALTHGVRHGLAVEVLLGAASIELDHDWRVEGDGQQVHGLALLLSVDLLLLSLGAWLLISLSR